MTHKDIDVVKEHVQFVVDTYGMDALLEALLNVIGENSQDEDYLALLKADLDRTRRNYRLRYGR